MMHFKRFIKGILLSLIVAVILNIWLTDSLQSINPLGATIAYAQDDEGDVGEDEPESIEDIVAEAEAAGAAAVAESDTPPASEATFEEVRGNIDPTPETPVAADKREIVGQIADLATKTHRIFAPMINFFSFQIGNFLGTDYVYQGGMGDMLHRIWIISRNLVNITFVFLLLWLALRLIFSPKFSMDDLKAKLVVFTLVMVAVNFSWLGTKVVLDASNVVTHAVFAIPSGIAGDITATSGTFNEFPQCVVNSDPEKPVTGACVPSAIFAPADSADAPVLYFEDTEDENDHCSAVKAAYANAYTPEGKKNPNASEENKKFQRRTSICMENLNLFSYEQNTAVIYLTYGMARIQNIVNANRSTDLVQLSAGVIMSLIIQAIFTIALLALYITLIIRMTFLWLFVGFSPFLVLMLYFKGDETDPFEQLKGKFDISAFLKWAFVPAKVGAIFVVSFIMISVGQAVGDRTGTLVDNLDSKVGVVNQLLEPQSLFMGAGSLQTFIWLIMCVVVLWMGVFAVLQDMPIVSVVTNKIRDYGNAVGQYVATLPYKAPILPLGKGGEKQSVEQMLAPLDVRSKLAKYQGIEAVTDTDVRTFNNRAPNQQMTKYMAMVDTGLSARQANQIARDYGFRDLTHMMQMEQRTLEEGFKRSKGWAQGNETALYNALKRTSERPGVAAAAATAGPALAGESQTAKEQRREEASQDIAKGVRMAGGVKTPPPAASPPAAAPPAGGKKE